MHGSNTASGKTGSGKTDELLKEILREIRALQPHRSRLRRGLVWILVALLTPVIAAIAVPGAHQTFAMASCYAKYLTQPHEAHPAAAMWQSYGVTSVKAESSTTVAINPTGASDIWYGAVMPVTRYCDYSVSFSAELIGPLLPSLSVGDHVIPQGC